MIDVAYGPSLTLVIRWHLEEAGLWNRYRGMPWIDPDRPAQLLEKFYCARHLLWVISDPPVVGNRG